MIRAGILTVSDRCSAGAAEDESGPALADALAGLGWEVAAAAVCCDDAGAIAKCLKDWSAPPKPLDLILTTGGTGLGPRDVTPEATRPLLDKELPGLGERMRREGERSAPLAALSRSLCGSRGRTLICNLPGSPAGARQSLDAVSGLIPHALKMLRGGAHREAPRRGKRKGARR